MLKPRPERAPDAPAPGRLDAPRAAASPFHERLLAEALTLRRPAGDIARMAPALSEARVDLNPHQLEAAAFALDSLASGGCLLADEVGLGKTIEAGMAIAQLVSEGKTRILILVPAPLRAQWRDELWEKFGLTAECLDGPSAKATGRPNPFDAPVPIICSVPFTANRSHDVARIPWDLVVIDEAHRLRNGYRIGHKTGTAIRSAVGTRPKILLTATPLQNDLFELYGLASLLDHTLLGSEESFRALYSPLLVPPPIPGSPGEEATLADRDEAQKDLKQRLAPVVQRTLRRQVKEYVRFTARRSIVEDFRPSLEEQELYDRVSDYLRREDTAAIEPTRRTLLTLVYRKILGSSSFAVGATLDRLANGFEARIENASKVLQAQATHLSQIAEEGDDGLEAEVRRLYEEEAEELLGESGPKKRPRTLGEMQEELRELREMAAQARAIKSNAKGDSLVRALDRAFTVARTHTWPEKAVIFTESRRTQDYLRVLLEGSGYAGQVSILCGDGSGPEERKALVEEFRDRTKILISTEAGAEGLNLQFCNLLVNFDLPWNPQRIEQRIGRCHRYGQTRDVLVINMVNRANAAEARLYDLLEQKLLLFDGVFGASDEVLGALESGVDFERRVLDIYQSCRAEHEVEAAFQKLRGDLEGKISSKMKEARGLLLERFDVDVRARLRLASGQAKAALKRQEDDARTLTLSVLGSGATASGDLLHVHGVPAELSAGDGEQFVPGLYSFGGVAEAEARGARRIGPGSALVKAAARAVRGRGESGVTYLTLDGSHVPTALAGLSGKEGWWLAYRLELGAAEGEERLLHLVLVREGGMLRALEPEVGALLADVPARQTSARPATGGVSLTSVQEAALERAVQKIRGEFEARRGVGLDRARERWDRFTEEALGRPRSRVDEAAQAWEQARKALGSAAEPDRPKARRGRDAAEREFRRRLDQLRLEEQRRYADKERALTEAARKAGPGEVKRSLVGTAYWFLA